MKSFSIRFLVALVVIASSISKELNAQNPSFYQPISGYNDLEIYKQINADPYVFKNGDLVNETAYPNWYKGLFFNNHPGVFANASDLYSFLSEDNRFNQLPVEAGSYYNQDSFSVQQKLYDLSRAKLIESRSFPNDQDFLNSRPSQTKKFRRYTTVYQEIYIKYKSEEFLILTTSNLMFDNYNMIPTESDRQKRVDFLSRSNTNFSTHEEANLRISFLFKEDGTWKWVASVPRLYEYFASENLSPALTQVFELSLATMDVKSTVNNSGVRVFEEY
ncbi:MAG: hypothetical protein WBG46_13700 [Nonlabens sp.]